MQLFICKVVFFGVNIHDCHCCFVVIFLDSKGEINDLYFLLVLGFNKIPLYGVFILTFGGALVFALIVRLVFVPWLKKKITQEVSESEEPIVKFCNEDEKQAKSKGGQAVNEESVGVDAVINFHDDSGIFTFNHYVISYHPLFHFFDDMMICFKGS